MDDIRRGNTVSEEDSPTPEADVHSLHGEEVTGTAIESVPRSGALVRGAAGLAILAAAAVAVWRWRRNRSRSRAERMHEVIQQASSRAGKTAKAAKVTALDTANAVKATAKSAKATAHAAKSGIVKTKDAAMH